MRIPAYLFFRPDTDTYYFRWRIPLRVQPLLGGRAEIRRTLRTNDKRVALHIARRLIGTLERGTFGLMANKPHDESGEPLRLIVKEFEKLADGTIRIGHVEMDPDRADEEQKLFAALTGSTGSPPPVPTAITAAAGSHTLSGLVLAYLAEGDRSKRWTPKSRHEFEQGFRLLVEVVGDKALSAVDGAVLRQFKETLVKLPRNRTKDQRYKNKSIPDLLAMEIPDESRLNVQTVNKLLTRTSSLMEWGVQNSYLDRNYAKGLTLRKGKRDDQERDAFTDTEVIALTKAVLGAPTDGRWQPYMKWVPLIGMYSGMRLEEICQLDLSDIHELSGFAVFDINDGNGKKLKTLHSRRTVPVHPELLRLGLLDYVNELRRKSETRLFPRIDQGPRWLQPGRVEMVQALSQAPRHRTALSQPAAHGLDQTPRS